MDEDELKRADRRYRVFLTSVLIGYAVLLCFPPWPVDPYRRLAWCGFIALVTPAILLGGRRSLRSCSSLDMLQRFEGKYGIGSLVSIVFLLSGFVFAAVLGGTLRNLGIAGVIGGVFALVAWRLLAYPFIKVFRSELRKAASQKKVDGVGG